MNSLGKIRITCTAMTDSLVLVCHGNDPNVALEKRECEQEVMEALTHHMLHDMPNGAKKKYCLGDQWYELQIKPCKSGSA